MSHIFHINTRQKCLYTSLTSAATVALLLSGCGSSESAPSDSASAAASSTQGTAFSSAAGQDTDDSEAAQDSFEGAEALADAPTVSLDQEQVVATEDLYTQFEGLLSSVETESVDASSSEENGGSSSEDSPADTGSTQLNEQTVANIEKIATGSAAEEFYASALEFGVNGWSQSGSSKIVGEPKVADTTVDGKSAKILEVCVDSSDITVKDSAGNSLTSSEGSKRSLNIFTLLEDNGSWKIAAHDFPNNPDC